MAYPGSVLVNATQQSITGDSEMRPVLLKGALGIEVYSHRGIAIGGRMWSIPIAGLRLAGGCGLFLLRGWWVKRGNPVGRNQGWPTRWPEHKHAYHTT
eukprot:6956586-Pyramimonas_sp.AAC.1